MFPTQFFPAARRLKRRTVSARLAFRRLRGVAAVVAMAGRVHLSPLSRRLLNREMGRARCRRTEMAWARAPPL